MLRAEIIAIGNELLLGEVLDTNTHWLCRQIGARGGHVQRAAMIADDGAAIADAVRDSLRRRPDLLILTGGLGPTADDMTLASLARGLDLPLELDSRALAMVRTTYAQLAGRAIVGDAALTEAREKMGYLPRGAEPLLNRVGAAPGVFLPVGDTDIVCLPGVPAELKDIFSHSLMERLGSAFGQQVVVERSVLTDCGDESLLAPIVDGVAEAHAAVYVKSRAKPYAEGVQLRILLWSAGTDGEHVSAAVDAAERDLRNGLREVGIAVLGREE